LDAAFFRDPIAVHIPRSAHREAREVTRDPGQAKAVGAIEAREVEGRGKVRGTRGRPTAEAERRQEHRAAERKPVVVLSPEPAPGAGSLLRF